ncbi:MAG: PepSY-associated TM helix domain-containing protein [Pseudomonadota bacterium]
MRGAFRQSMTWLHTWSGLVFCWILYFMFVTGTLGYFDTEIDHWMMPEMPPAADVSPAEAYRVAQRRLEEEAEGADRWLVAHASGREEPHLRVFWQLPRPEGAEDVDPELLRGNEQLDAGTGKPLPELARSTGGGQLLYRMHYVLHYLDEQAAFRLVGAITMLMFLAMVTGIVVHKKIFKDFFTFRPARGQRSWLDMHNLLSVSSLPFLLMITYSGLIFMVTVWMPGIALGSYGFDTQKAQAELGALANTAPPERSGETAELLDLGVFIAQVETEWGEGKLRSLNIQLPGDANARVVANEKVSNGVSGFGRQIVFDGVSGERLDAVAGAPNSAIGVAAVLIGLHEGLFAGPFLRWLYFVAGLVGTAMVATGAIYWTAKRRKPVADSGQSRGFRLVECLNIGTIVGLPVAVAAYFLANRLLPLGFEGRAEWEAHALFLVWGSCLLYPLFRPRLEAWRELTWAAALACGSLPIVNALTTDKHLLNSVAAGDRVMAAFDLTALAFGFLFAVLASRLSDQQETAQTVDDEAVDTVTAP